MPRFHWILCACLLLVTAAEAQDNGWECPYSANQDSLPWMHDPTKGSTANPIVQKVIFVAFDSSENAGPEFDDDRSDALQECAYLFSKQSAGHHDIDYQVVKVPGDTHAVWKLSSRGQDDFLHSGEFGSFGLVSRFMSFRSSWSDTTQSGFYGELQARVMELIKDTFDDYYGENAWTSPLSGADAVLIAILPDAGGRSRNPLGVYSPTLGMPFLSLDVNTVDTRIAPVVNAAPSCIGCTRMLGSVVLVGPQHPKRNVTVIAHMWGHVIGLDDFIKAYQSGFSSHAGAYSIMKFWLSEDEQDYAHLALIDHPSRVWLHWIDPIVVTANRKDEILSDVWSGGGTYRIPIRWSTHEVHEPNRHQNWYTVADEYFLIAYEDGHSESYGASDTGVYIWHCLEFAARFKEDWDQWHADDAFSRYQHRDLEIATGLYLYPGTREQPDAAYGRDSLDYWLGRDENEYVRYNGSTEDLFDIPGVTEFSYRIGSPRLVNPSSYGYHEDATSLSTEGLWLFPADAPQDVATSISVRLKARDANGVMAELLVAPFEVVLQPNGGEVLQVGQPCDITWSKEFTTDQPDGIVTTVDIYCSRGEGYGDLLIASGVDATLGTYQWTPAAIHASKTCKIRVVCHNINDVAHVGEDVSDDTFVVADLTEAKFTDVSGQTGLSYSGQPYSAAPGDLLGDANRDLLVSVTGDDMSMNRALGVNPSGGPQFWDQGQLTGPSDGRGVAIADFDNDGDQDIFVAHATTPKLWRSQGGYYYDITASSGLSILASGSLAACWGDYDRDGLLDLFVSRGTAASEPPSELNISGDQPRLFRNLGNGSFSDVTSAANLSGFANACVSPTWGDIDGDGDLDIIALDLDQPPAHNDLLFINQGNGSFLEEHNARMYYPGIETYYVTGAVLADMNNDGALDIVYSSAAAGSSICLNDGTGYFHGDQRITLPPMVGEVGSCYSGLQVFDHDLDGWQDVVLISTNPSAPSRSFSCVSTPTGVTFFENTDVVGLSGSSRALGSASADFTRDGDFDIFVGRATADGQYFYKTDALSGANSLDRNYVKVRLASPLKANNWQGIGATVTVSAGNLVQTQLVDGGSGRGGQRDRELIFGLGAYSGSVTATVNWPCGYVQADVPLVVGSSAFGDTVNTVVDETMVISNLNAASIVVPGTTLFDWVFTWDTNVACDSSQDVLTFDQAGIQNPCWPGWTVLTPSNQGVTYTYEPKSGGGYLHTFTIYGQECNLGCSFRYWAFSAMGTNQATSATKTKKVKFCASGF